MKTLLALTFAVFSSAIFAMPAVGDMVTYRIKTQGVEVIQKVELDSCRNF